VISVFTGLRPGHAFRKLVREFSVDEPGPERGLLGCAHCASTQVSKAIIGPKSLPARIANVRAVAAQPWR